MNKKNIFRLPLLMALPLMATACQFEDEDFFDESASLRVEHTTKDVKDILVKPENGWVMQYFCGTGVAHFEGFNLFAKFDASMKVTLAGDHRMLRNGNAGKYTESSSLYSLLLEDGPVLAFNTWNDVLTPFVDPVDPWKAPNTLAKDGAGMQGDNNFVIESYKDNEILLRGERYGGKVRLVACDRTWQDYITACNDMKKKVTNNTIVSYYITDGTDTLYLTGLSRGRIRMAERLSNPLRNDSLATVFTPTGLHFEKTDTVGTKAFQDFNLAEDNSRLETADKAVSIIPCWDTYMADHAAVWKLDNTLFNAEQNDLFDKINAELKKSNANYELESIGIGKATSVNAVHGLTLTFYTNAAKTRTNTASYEIISTLLKYGVIEFALTEKDNVDKNMTSISAKATEIINLSRDFANTLKGTYEIVPDDYFLPKGGTFTAIDGGTSFVLK